VTGFLHPVRRRSPRPGSVQLRSARPGWIRQAASLLRDGPPQRRRRRSARPWAGTCDADTATKNPRRGVSLAAPASPDVTRRRERKISRVRHETGGQPALGTRRAVPTGPGSDTGRRRSRARRPDRRRGQDDRRVSLLLRPVDGGQCGGGDTLAQPAPIAGSARST